MQLLDLLRGTKAPTAASLQEALAQAEADRAAATRALDNLQQKRTEALLDADDQFLDLLEADIRSAQRQIDRIELLGIQAQERLAEAVERERRAELARPGEPTDLAWSATSMRQKFANQVALPSSSEWYRLMLPSTNAFGRPLRPDEGSPDR